MSQFIPLICPKHQTSLVKRDAAYVCKEGCRYPIVSGIPRFVEVENYASSFGIQWNEFRKTQLDSFTGLSISEKRLRRLFGGHFDFLRGKQLL